MSNTRTKIYNIVLHNLGVSAPIHDTEQQDPRAILLNNYYEIARDTVLEAHEWIFANANFEGLSEINREICLARRRMVRRRPTFPPRG